MKESFWTGNGKNAWIAKAVISSTGHAVAKNYLVNGDDRDTRLRIGDLGITMRLDRKLDGMTPEQRLAAQDLAQAMFTDLMRVLGKEVIEGSGIPIGSFIRCGEVEYRVEKETKLGLHLRRLHYGFLDTTSFATWENLGYVSLLSTDELREAVRCSFSTLVWGYNDSRQIGTSSIENFRRFADFWSEERLADFFLKTRVNQSHDINRNLIDDNQQPWLHPALEAIQGLANLQRIADHAINEKVRETAMNLLLERTYASTPDP